MTDSTPKPSENWSAPPADADDPYTVWCTAHTPQSKMVQVAIDPDYPWLGAYLCVRCMQSVTLHRGRYPA